MEKTKKIIIAISIVTVIIILISVLLILNLKREKEGYQQEIDDNYVIDRNENIIYQSRDVTDGTMFFTVEDCVQKYLNGCIINLNSGERLDLNYEYTDANERKEALYHLLTEQYIKENNITPQNILQYVDRIEEEAIVTVTDMKVQQVNDRIQQYLIKGFVEHAKTGEFIKDIQLIVLIDISSKTFQIEPRLQENNFSEKENMQNEKIEPNEYNVFDYYKVVKNDIPQKYMEFYFKLALKYPEKAYQYLDTEYREKRFGTFEDYSTYIMDNREEIMNTKLDRYQIEAKDDYTQYVCIDQNENYFIFRENAIRKFSLILDTHTIDLPEFTNKYEGATQQQKVAMNIEKVVEALNMKDYTYVYKKLDAGFKQNYFQTEQNFIQYASLIFNNRNKVTYGEFEVEGNVYIYNITLTDRKGESIKVHNKQFIMKLGEGTDFTCSFTTGDDKLVDDNPGIENT